MLSAIFLSNSTFDKHLYHMYVFSLSVVSNACDLPCFQAEFVKKLLNFEERRKTEEELNTKVTLILYVRHIYIHVFVYSVNVHELAFLVLNPVQAKVYQAAFRLTNKRRRPVS